MLGADVCAAGASAGDDVRALTHEELDITDAALVEAAMRRAAPDLVVNCAAWTDVDGAEASPGAARAVNGAGAGNVARAAASCGAWTVHVSSDYVFDGAKREPYVESDRAAPLSQYGRSKLEGELSVAREAPELYTIVRSAWLFGLSGRCFPLTILRLARERDVLTVVDDQIGCPTFTAHLAPVLLALGRGRVSGLVHASAGGHCSWFEFARAIVQLSGAGCDVRPGRTAELGRPAPRPAYSVLATERPAEVPALPDWQDGLSTYMAGAVTAR